MGAGSASGLGGMSLGHREHHRRPVMSTSSHHPTGSPHRKSRIAGAEVRLRGIDFSIALTITVTETVLGATTFTT